MDGLVRKLLVTIGVIALTGVSLIMSPVQSHADNSQTPGLTATGTRAFNDLTRCISTKQKLDVYYLVDESNSLPLTDPDSARAGILATSLKELAGFDSTISVNYAVGFFGSTFDSWKGFAPVTPSNIASQASAFESEVRARNKQNETNWLAGLDGAAKQLEQQEQISHGCQALIWLTDGGLWLAKQGSTSQIDQSAVDAATSTLCDVTFENLRKSNVSVFGVLLDNTKALQDIYKNNPTYYGQNDRGMALMRPLVEGSGATLPGQQSTTCGGPILPNYSAGALLIAKDPIALALQFLVLGGQTHGGTPSDLPPGNPTSFDIERGVRKFQVLTTSKHWQLTSPNGTTFNDGTTSLDVQNQNGVQQITVSGSQLSLGKWKIGFDSAGQVVNRLLLYSGLAVQLDPGQYIGGSKTYISGQIVVDGSKEKVKLSDYRTHEFEIDQVTSSGESIKIRNVKIDDSGNFSAPFDLTSNQTNLEIRITLKISTLSGKNLSDVSISKFLTVLLPSNYPTIDSPILLSPINGPKGIGKGVITIHGPKVGNGQLCFAGGSPYGITIQRDAVSRTTSYNWQIGGLDPSNCVSVTQGSTKQLTVSSKNSTIADAKVIAEVPLKFLSQDKPDPINLKAPIDFETTIIRAGRGIVKVLLFFLGIGIPLLILFLLNKSNSKLIFGNGIQRASFKIRIDSTSGISSIDGSKLTAIADDFKFIPQQPDTAAYKDAVGEIRARVSLIPLSEPWYEIESLPDYRLLTVHSVSDSGLKKLKKRFLSGQIARIQSDMGKFWTIQIAEKDLQTAQSSSYVTGTLVIYKRNRLGATSQHLDRLAEVVATGGIWSRLTEMKQVPLTNLPKVKEDKIKEPKRSKKSEVVVQPVAQAPSGSNPPAPPTLPPSLPPLPPGGRE
jgi:hypothetical protein